MLRPMEQVLHQHCRLLYRVLKPREATGNLGLALNAGRWPPHAAGAHPPEAGGQPVAGRLPAGNMLVLQVAKPLEQGPCLFTIEIARVSMARW